MKKRVLRLLLCIVLVLSLLPTVALATSGVECQEASCSHVAAIGSLHYATLDAALAATAADSEVKLLSNASMSKDYTLVGDLTLDLNGYEITNTGNITTFINSGHRLVVQDGSVAQTGKITFTNTKTGYNAKKIFDIKGEGAYLELQGGTVTYNKAADADIKGTVLLNVASSAAAQIKGGKLVNNAAKNAVSGGNITVSGGEVVNNCEGASAIYLNGALPITVTGGSVLNTASGGYAMNLSGAKAEISGGLIQNTGAGGYAVSLKNKASLTMSAGTIENTDGAHKPVYYSGSSVTVTGGTIKGAVGAELFPYDYQSSYYKRLNFSGGSYSAAPYDSYIATGCWYFYNEGTGLYDIRPVTESDAEAKIIDGDTTYYYLTLDAAITQKKPGDTIYLVKDIETDSAIVLSGALVLDGDGHTIRAKEGGNFEAEHGTGLLYNGSGSTTVQNVTLDCNGQTRAFYNYYGEGNQITFDTVTVINAVDEADGVSGLYITGSASTVTINNCTFADNTGEMDIWIGSGYKTVTVTDSTIDAIGINGVKTADAAEDVGSTLIIDGDGNTIQTVKLWGVDTSSPDVAEEEYVSAASQIIINGGSVSTILASEGTDDCTVKVLGLVLESEEASLENGEIISGTFTTETGEIVSYLDLPSYLPGILGELPFEDVLWSDWFYDEVKEAWEADLIDGMTPTTFEPYGDLTVAQAIKLAAALHQLDTWGKVSLTNGSPNWYDSYVDYAVANGIIEAKYAYYTLAQMNAPVSRREFVHILHGALPASDYVAWNAIADNAIPDVKMGDACAAEIYDFYRAGILNGGKADGSFLPGSNIKRSEVAAILIRMYDQNARLSVSLP